VLITGHTGFKGSWLSHWLLDEGAEVSGFALPPETAPALFTALGLAGRMHHVEGDIRDLSAIRACVQAVAPEVVFHLAAQPLVRRSYRDPAATWAVNVLGTTHLLEAVRGCPAVRACVVVTSDKCYENRGWTRGYSEEDVLGGHDPYSSSKAAVEIAAASWRRSFQDLAPVATARAGNVIGGGDWSEDRLIPDFIAAVSSGRELRLRNPLATRPWQHVLEPLGGYLELARRLLGSEGRGWAEAWNFGPADGAAATVREVADALVEDWGSGQVVVETAPAPHEAQTLRLDCSKAAGRLGWRPRWTVREAVRLTARWYRGFADGVPAVQLCQQDLTAYRRAQEPGARP